MLQRFRSKQIINFTSFRLIMMSFLLILTGGQIAHSSPCDEAKAQFELRFETLQSRTLKDFNEKISNPENFPIWINGKGKNKNEIIYLVHGFIGTPFEMRSTAERLISSGYTVVLDVLPGHGVSAEASNSFSKLDLQNHVFANLKAITQCASKVHLVGFSTGATLLHHFLQTNSAPSVATISLISPYYQPTITFGDLLSQGSAFFISTLSVDFAYSISHFSDIKVAFLDPDHYHKKIPLDLANEINSLGEETGLTKANIHVPVLLLTSSHDKIASPSATHVKIAQDFSNIKLMHYNSFNFAPHHLMADPVSPVADQVHQLISDFIQKH